MHWLKVKNLYIWKNIFYFLILSKSSSTLSFKALWKSCLNLLRQTSLSCLLSHSPSELTLFLFVARVRRAIIEFGIILYK